MGFTLQSTIKSQFIGSRTKALVVKRIRVCLMRESVEGSCNHVMSQTNEIAHALKCLISLAFEWEKFPVNEKCTFVWFMLPAVVRMFHMREKTSQVFHASPSLDYLLTHDVGSHICTATTENLCVSVSRASPEADRPTFPRTRIIHLIQWKMCCLIKVNHRRTAFCSLLRFCCCMLGPLIAFSASSQRIVRH